MRLVGVKESHTVFLFFFVLGHNKISIAGKNSYALIKNLNKIGKK